MKIRLGILCCLIVWPGILSASTNDMTWPRHNPVRDIIDWEYSWGDVPESTTWMPIRMPAQPKDRKGQNWLWERTLLPDDLPPDAAVFFRSVDQIFEVYVGDSRIYQFGDLSVSPPRPYIGYSGHLIRLPESAAGQTLRVRVYSEYPSIGIFSRVSLGSRADLIKSLIRNEIMPLSLGMFFLIIGVFVLLLFLWGDGARLVNQTSAFLTFGLVELSIGFMVIAQLHLKTILYYNPLFWMYLDLMSLFLIPVFVHAFYQSIAQPGTRRLIGWLWKSHLAFFLLSLLLDILGWVPLHAMLKPFEYLLLPTAGIMLVSIAIGFYRGNTDVRIFTLGIVSLILFGLYDILGDMRLIPWTHSVLHWGMLLFTFTLLVIIIRRFQDISGRLSANERELEIARLVQKEVLPSELSLEQFAELEIVVSYLPQSGNVGGDYYSITPLREGLASIAIADATGHGIQAALSTMQIDVLIRENMEITQPHEKLTNINSILTRSMSSKNFFTCFVLNLYHNRIEYSSAGHPEQLLYHGREKILARIHTRGKPIGLLPDPSLEMKTEPVAQGDYIILYSDGVYEEFDDKEEQLGLEGFFGLVQDAIESLGDGLNPHELQTAILHSLSRYNQGRAYQDDVTLIVIKMKES